MHSNVVLDMRHFNDVFEQRDSNNTIAVEVPGNDYQAVYRFRR